MQIISKKLEVTTDPVYFSKIGPMSRVLCLDLETTGLSAEHNRIYLIGCAYWQQDGWQLIQWFDDSGQEEQVLLESFLAFAKPYTTFLHYNGDRFDMPFLMRRLKALGIAHDLDSRVSLDLYKAVRPYKRVLGLASYSQGSIEAFLGTGREEDNSGKDLIRTYLDYTAEKEASLLTPLLAHNEADVRGLVMITPLFWLRELFQAQLKVNKAEANYYKDYSGTPREEIILHAKAAGIPEGFLPNGISASRDGCYIHVRGNRVTIKIPLYRGELKYYYAGYQDYYYLPATDEAIHKSIASFVDPSHRVQATAKTCYTRKSDAFLPEWSLFRTPFFKKDYADKNLFFTFTDDMKKDRDFFCEYAEYVFRHVTGEYDSDVASGAPVRLGVSQGDRYTDSGNI